VKKADEASLRILYLNARQKSKYIIIQRGITIHSRVSFRKAGELLKTIPIDLIFSQRQRLVVCTQNFLSELPQTLGKTVRAFLPQEEQQAA
jgi:hypothetical protein